MDANPREGPTFSSDILNLVVLNETRRSTRPPSYWTLCECGTGPRCLSKFPGGKAVERLDRKDKQKDLHWGLQKHTKMLVDVEIRFKRWVVHT